MQTLKTVRAFFAYPDGFTRTEYAENQVITLPDDAAKSYIDAGHCVPHVEEADQSVTVNPDEFKTLGELKDAVGAKTLKEVEALVEALGHEVPDKRAVAPIPLAIYETIVNKHNTAIEEAKAAEEKAEAVKKEQAESDAKAKETEAAVAEKQAADLERMKKEEAAHAKAEKEANELAKAKADEAAKAETVETDPAKTDKAHKADGTGEA